MIKTTAPVADPGDPSPPPPPLFIDQTEARGAEIKFFGRPPLPPFSKGLDDRPPLSQGGLDPAVHVSRFLASCFSTFLLRPLHDCDVKPPNATLYGERGHMTTNFPFSILTWVKPLAIQLQICHLHLTN